MWVRNCKPGLEEYTISCNQKGMACLKRYIGKVSQEFVLEIYITRFITYKTIEAKSINEAKEKALQILLDLSWQMVKEQQDIYGAIVKVGKEMEALKVY